MALPESDEAPAMTRRVRPRARLRTVLIVLVLAAPSILTSVLVSRLFNASILDYFPSLSDEIVYHHQIGTFVSAGFKGGYYGFYEATAPLSVSHFGVHGPAFPVMFGLPGRLMGWHLYSGPLFNLLLLAAAVAGFLVLTDASRTTIVSAGALILTSWWVILNLSTTMQETLNQAFMIVVAGLTTRRLRDLSPGRATLWLTLAILAVSSVLRPTNWILAAPLVFAELAPAGLGLACLGALVTTTGLPLFWMLWRYISAPIPGLTIDLPGLTGTRAAARLSAYFLHQIAENGAAILNVKSLTSEPFWQHVVFESLLLTGVVAASAGAAMNRAWTDQAGSTFSRLWKNMRFRVDVFSFLSLGSALIAFFGFYFDAQGSISRVTTPFLLLCLLILAATGGRGMLLGAILVANVFVMPSFVRQYRDLRIEAFTFDRTNYERLREELAAHIVFNPNQGPWCNTLLVMNFRQELLAVPPGIGLSFGSPTKSVLDPVKSNWLLLTEDDLSTLEDRARLEHVATTALGELYRNLGARCR